MQQFIRGWFHSFWVWREILLQGTKIVSSDKDCYFLYLPFFVWKCWWTLHVLSLILPLLQNTTLWLIMVPNEHVSWQRSSTDCKIFFFFFFMHSLSLTVCFPIHGIRDTHRDGTLTSQCHSIKTVGPIFVVPSRKHSQYLNLSCPVFPVKEIKWKTSK